MIRPLLRLLLVLSWTGAASAAVPLIGFGTVEASFSDAGAIFRCEDEAHADIVLSKLRCDLTWDERLGIHEVRLPNGAPAYQLEGSGIVVLARTGRTVYACAGPSPDDAARAMRDAGLDPAACAFAPARRHPATLDFFDLNAVRMSYHAFDTKGLADGFHNYDRDVLTQRYAFWSPLRIPMGANLRDDMISQRVDGPPLTFPTEYEIGLARKAGQSVNFWLGSCVAPWWLANRFPGDVARSEGVWIWGNALARGTARPSLCLGDGMRAYVDRFNDDYLRRVRAAAGDSLASIRIATGRPGDELGLHNLSTELMIYGPADVDGFRRWMQGRVPDLQALGQRWYDDPGHFQSWAEVAPPSNFKFFGGFEPASLDLGKGWLRKPNGAECRVEDWGQSRFQAGPEWTATDLAPSQRQLLPDDMRPAGRPPLDDPTAWWLRKEFNADAWLAGNAGKAAYLVVDAFSQKPAEVYLNGRLLGTADPKAGGILGVQVTDLLHSGDNVLCLKVAGDGMIHGPVFLTPEEPKRYPYLGRQGNARWIDLRDWEVESLVDGYRRIALPVQRQVPDVPVLLTTGSSWSTADYLQDLKRSAGFSAIHDTGSEASYRPHWPGFGYVIGTYGSCEESNTPRDPLRLSAELGWFLLDAVGSHNYVYDTSDYQRIEQQTQWFTKNRRLLELVGKAVWEKPRIAVLLSARNTRLFPFNDFFNSWDVGRGTLEATHYANVYVTESEVKSGLVRDYPVLFDCNSMVLDAETVKAIEAYVREGGTFVALNATGRHDPLEPDAWPISAVTGFRVIGERRDSRMTVEPGNPLLPSLGGITFPGSGSSVNWIGQNAAQDSIALQPVDSGTQAIARWEDGSTAIGLRRLGKGRVVVLGSTFWRNASDRAGKGVTLNGPLQTRFLNELFASLGVAKQADCDNDTVWVRREITKNGLQEWIVAYNSQDAPATADITFLSARRPARVIDMNSGDEVPFDYADGRVRLPKVVLAGQGTRVFAVSAGGFAKALHAWFEEKMRYWRPPEIPNTASFLPRPPYTALVFDAFRFRPAGPDAPTDLQWLREPTDTPAWKDAGPGFWDELGAPAKGVGLYRTSFPLPAGWEKRRVVLSLTAFDYPVFLENASIYLNGTKVYDYKGHGWSNFETQDVSADLHPGQNEIGVVVEAREGRGGYIGQMSLYPLHPLRETLSLSQWELHQSQTGSVPLPLPAQKRGMYAATTVAVPSGWDGKPVLLQITSPQGRFAMAMVNGQPVTFIGGHPIKGVFQIDVSPWLKPGAPNRIELWPYDSIPNPGHPASGPATIALQEACLGIADPDGQPPSAESP